MGPSKSLAFGVDSKHNKFYYTKMHAMYSIIPKCMQ